MTKARKSLALGSALALAATGFVSATPAFASDLSLSSAAGTSYKVLLSDDFTLHAAVAGNTNIANTAALAYAVSNPSGETLVVSAEYWDTAANAGVGGYADATGTLNADGDLISVVDTTQTIGKVNKLTINPTTDKDSDTFTVTVTAFSDMDASGSITAGDLTSPSVTLTFVNGDDVVASPAIATPVAGAAPTVEFTLSGGINLEQTAAGNFNVDFAANGVADNNAAAALNSDKDALGATAGNNASAGEVITAQVQIVAYDGATAADTGAKATATVPAASTAASAAASDIVKSTDVSTIAALAGSTDAVLLPSGQKSYSYTVTFKDANGALVTGAPATVTATDVDLTAAKTVKVNGKTLTAGGAAQVANVLTDSAGQVTVTVTEANAATTETVTITVASNAITHLRDVNWVDRAPSTLAVLNEPAGNANRVAVKGDAFSLSYVVLDQFDKAWTKADTNYRLSFAVGGAGATATAPGTLTLSNGAGTLAWTDNSTGTVDYTLTATLQSQTGAGAWADDAAALTDVTNFDMIASRGTVAKIDSATVVLGDAGAVPAAGITLTDKDIAAVDRRVYDNANAALGVTNTTVAKLVLTAKTDVNTVVEGATVTLSGAGLGFSADATGSSLVTVGSMSAVTDSSGQVTVYVLSNSSGKQTITASVGGVSKDVEATWAAAAATAGKTLTVNVANAVAGKTMTVSGTLVDKYGNAVETAAAGLKVTYTGPGFVNGSLPTVTDSDGAYSFKVLLGSNDTISGSVKVVYAGANGVVGTGDDDVEVSTDLAPAAPAADTKVNAGSFKGYVAVYAKGHEGKRLSAKIGNDWVVVESLASNFERIVDFTGAGYTISVRIYIDRVLEDTIVVTTK
jgi:hypothetical protein